VTSGVCNELITSPYHLLSVADIARRAALANRGVAHLSFPIDVQEKSLTDDDESLGRDVQHGSASSWVPQIEVPPADAVRAAAGLLNAGRRTVLLMGQGALRATSEVEAVAVQRAAPVVKAFLGKTVIADTSPYSAGGIGEFGTTAASAAMKECDTLLIAGSTMPWLHYYPKPGHVGFACARPEEVRPALEAAWQIADRPALIEATIDNDADVSPPDDYLAHA
jgi:pyruvate dehydrogenase (quinone)